MKKTRRHKLRFQVIIIMIVFYIISVVGISGVMFYSNTGSFVSAKKEMLLRDLDMMYNNITEMEGYEWFFGFAKQHPDDVAQNMTVEDLMAIYDLDLEFPADGTQKEMAEFLDSLTYDQQLFYSRNIYDRIDYLFNYEYIELGYDTIGIVDIADVEKNETTFVYFETLANEFAKLGVAPQTIGDTIAANTDKDRAVFSKLLSTGNGEVMYDLTSNQYGYYIYAFMPITSLDSTKAVMYISYDYTTFYQKLTKGILLIVISTLVVMFVICVLTLFAIDRVAISPLSMLRNSVKGYSENKDVEAACTSIEKIRSHYIAEEIDGLSLDFSSMVSELEDYMEHIRVVTAEKERIGSELDMARGIQESALPNVFPAFPERNEFDIYASMTPAKEVGGDFYDMFLTDEDHLALVIADVSGKGVPAALFMMMSKILIHTYTMTGLSPAKVLESTNAEICQSNTQDMFVTVWLGILEISTGKLTAANAGHEFPVIRRPDGNFELFKDRHGFVVGGMGGVKYKEYELMLEKGSTLFVYTDGVPEATDANKKMFGTDRLVEVLNREPDAEPEKLLKNVHEAVDDFVGDAPQFDDLTMLSVKLL